MKPHFASLAVSVLCFESALFAGRVAAQAPAPPAEAPAPTVTVTAPGAAPVPAPPPTLVDTPPPTAVNASPAVPPSPAPAVAASAPPAVAPAVPSSSSGEPGADVPASVGEREPSLGLPRYRDAHHDRLLLAPTAETNPKGSFYATSYEIVFLQLGYSLSDSTQLSLTSTPPLGEEHVVPADISLKTVLLREPHVSVAALASASGILGFEEVSGFIGRAGAVASFCADALECRLSFSISSNIALIGPGSLLFNGAGLSFRAGRIVSLIAELDSLIPLGEAVGEANGLLGGVGVRLSGRAWGVDLALMRAGKARADLSPVVPFLAVTYRYVP